MKFDSYRTSEREVGREGKENVRIAEALVWESVSESAPLLSFIDHSFLIQ